MHRDLTSEYDRINQTQSLHIAAACERLDAAPTASAAVTAADSLRALIEGFWWVAHDPPDEEAIECGDSSVATGDLAFEILIGNYSGVTSVREDWYCVGDAEQAAAWARWQLSREAVEAHEQQCAHAILRAIAAGEES